MIYNGHDFKNILRDELISRSFLPGVNVSTVEVPGRHGSLFADAKLDPLAITVAVRLIPGFRSNYGFSYEEARRKIAGMLFSRKPSKLILRDDPTRHYYAILSGESQIEKLLGTGQSSLTFICPEPIAIGNERNITLGEGTTSFHLDGTAPSFPVLRLSASAEEMKVTCGDKYILPNIKLSQGDAVEIDCATERVTVNGNTVGVSLFSDYFEVEPDVTTIKVEGGSGYLVVSERWY
ncbi:MAG: phage tail family protein [Raoultibacter sp.]